MASADGTAASTAKRGVASDCSAAQQVARHRPHRVWRQSPAPSVARGAAAPYRASSCGRISAGASRAARRCSPTPSSPTSNRSTSGSVASLRSTRRARSTPFTSSTRLRPASAAASPSTRTSIVPGSRSASPTDATRRLALSVEATSMSSSLTPGGGRRSAKRSGLADCCRSVIRCDQIARPDRRPRRRSRHQAP